MQNVQINSLKKKKSKTRTASTKNSTNSPLQRWGWSVTCFTAIQSCPKCLYLSTALLLVTAILNTDVCISDCPIILPFGLSLSLSGLLFVFMNHPFCQALWILFADRRPMLVQGLLLVLPVLYLFAIVWTVPVSWPRLKWIHTSRNSRHMFFKIHF